MEKARWQRRRASWSRLIVVLAPQHLRRVLTRHLPFMYCWQCNDQAELPNVLRAVPFNAAALHYVRQRWQRPAWPRHSRRQPRLQRQRCIPVALQQLCMLALAVHTVRHKRCRMLGTPQPRAANGPCAAAGHVPGGSHGNHAAASHRSDAHGNQSGGSSGSHRRSRDPHA